MSEKREMHEITKMLMLSQYLDKFCITKPIAEDFVSDHIVADMYCDDSQEGLVKYVTLGMCQNYFDNGWYEFSFATTERLERDAEEAMQEEISYITCKLTEREYDDAFCGIYTGMVIPAIQAVKEVLGYDGFILEIHDMNFRTLTSEELLILLLVPVYENEMKFIKENGYDLFSEKYDALVPDEEQLLVGVKRKPLDL